ncbi:MAG TPA: 4Fe-4S dicluster domain-containing protein [Kofleriaceae bacterium]|jgi:molybdopterin-containing oxidoreductase family iron-sulfur binding subunit
MSRPIGLDALSRRQFFKLAGIGAAAAGLAGCSSRPEREIIPYGGPAPELVPGVATYYATSLVQDGYATGVVVETHEGRPTKVEGNPDHPASLGGTRAIEQAAVLSLYDPQRLRVISNRGIPSTWSAIEQLFVGARSERGRGTHLLVEPTSSLLVGELLARVRGELPSARVTFWAPFATRASLDGHRIAFGQALERRLSLRDADVIVALDADLVGDEAMALAHARHLADGRRVIDGRSRMNRLYAIETSYSPTGILADHRFRVRPSEMQAVASGLLAELALLGKVPGGYGAQRATGARASWIAAIARDLVTTNGRVAVVAGERQTPAVHAIVAAINAALGSTCVQYARSVLLEAGEPSHDLAPLAAALQRGEVKTLVVIGGNPSYTAPADVPLAFENAEHSVYLGPYANETARRCRHVVPGLHDLERWDAVRAQDGTISPQQPMIEPLFQGHSASDLLAAMLGDVALPARVRFDAAWARLVGDRSRARSLQRGVVEGSAFSATPVQVAWSAIPVAPSTAPSSHELEIKPHPYVHDGRYANNPWLLELPDPITKLTWDNAIHISPRTAREMGVGTGDVLALTVGERSLQAPAIVVPGQADGAFTLHAGFGRDGDEAIAHGVGVSVFGLWEGARGFSSAVEVKATGARRELAITQEHWRLEGRDELPSGSLAQLGTDDELLRELARQRGPQPTLLDAAGAGGAQWAMSIDLTTCSGCSACVMACSAENNTPVVGRDRVLERREMHWLRLDRYADERDEDAPIRVEPMTCQHCEKAPCEYVCPVAATTHSDDGINEMTYNRCVGTRFCSNNCPYKVRRFNWFDLKEHEGLRVLGRNPDVTVRDRGVMEKCTYCVQRVRRAEIDAREAGRALEGRDVRTACQQACPTQAISFGSLNDATTPVREHRQRPHDYTVLHDQGTVPRTHYLARIRNRNPEIA